MAWFKFRTSEWVLIGFFAYVALLSPAFPDRPGLTYQPWLVLLAVFMLLLLLARAGQTRVISMVRDWLPILLTLAAFREMELFLPPHFDYRYEAAWIRWDHFLFDKWPVRTAIESLGPVIPFYLELCYLLVYGLSAYCVAVLYAQQRRPDIDRFFTVYLVGTLAAYAVFPFFPSQPPRIAFPESDMPSVITWAREANLYILSKATIHVGVFPSAHVSSAFSSAWAMFLLFPERKTFGWGLFFYAVSVSVATVYGRYHYAADVVAGFGISFIAAALCWRFRNRSR